MKHNKRNNYITINIWFKCTKVITKSGTVKKEEAANAGSAVPVPSQQAKNQLYCEEIPGSLLTSQRAHPAIEICNNNN